MNRYKYFYLLFIIIAAAACIALAGCTKKFDAYNTNPNQATEADLNNDFVGLGVFIPQMEENVVVADPQAGVAPYQTIQNLNADIFSGYNGTPTAFNGGSSNAQYNINGSWSNKAFDNPYTTIMADWLQVKIRAVSHPDFYALANIIKVAGMHRVTDIFGPMPYSQFGAGGFEVGYDSQQAIYNSFFSELDSAIATLTTFVTNNPGVTPAQNYDLVYQGNYTEWIKFANSLKLRLAMHIVYADPALAQQEAEAAVNNSYGVMTTNADNAFLSSSPTVVVYNPLYTIDVGFGDIRFGAVLQSLLTGYNDPRIPDYMLTAPGFPNTPYIGVRTGINLSAGNYRQMSGINVTLNAPIQWMTAAEVDFLRAEGALRGWNMGETAQYFYQQGIQTSFTQYGVSGAAYITNSTNTAAPYTDPYNSVNNVPAGSPELSTITIQWDNTAAFETNLERIITQKYIAMFPNGQEAWTEFRRTGYPKIWPVVENFSNGAISTQIQIRRLPYPPNEYSNNDPSVTQAVSTLLGGPDNGGTKLWWDQKP
jgi:hypothetical protein